MADDVRWKQRFSNFRNALKNLDLALSIPSPDIIQRAGMVQFFEMCFELALNVLKDYLEEQGFTDVRSPRTAIKKAFEIGLLSDASVWLKGLEDRNLTSHLYNEQVAKEVVVLVSAVYAPLFHNLETVFLGLFDDSI